MLNYSVRCIPVLEKYFSVKFPLPKLDLVAVPDFAMAAMENWGVGFHFFIFENIIQKFLTKCCF